MQDDWTLHSTVDGVERWESHNPAGYFILTPVDKRWAEPYFQNRSGRALAVHFGPQSFERAKLTVRTASGA